MFDSGSNAGSVFSNYAFYPLVCLVFFLLIGRHGILSKMNCKYVFSNVMVRCGDGIYFVAYD